jgi:hypothetical protein
VTTWPEFKQELLKQLGSGGESSEFINEHQSLANQVASIVAGVTTGAAFAQSISGNTYVQDILNIGPHGSITNTLNQVQYTPILLGAGTLDRISINHFASPTASEVVRLGIYKSSSSKPSSLLIDAGTIDLSTALNVKSIPISLPVTRDLYWLASCRQGPTNTSTLVTWNVSSSGNVSFALKAPVDNTLYSSQRGMYVETGTISGALPSVATPTSIINISPPVIGVRYV